MLGPPAGLRVVPVLASAAGGQAAGRRTRFLPPSLPPSHSPSPGTLPPPHPPSHTHHVLHPKVPRIASEFPALAPPDPPAHIGPQSPPRPAAKSTPACSGPQPTGPGPRLWGRGKARPSGPARAARGPAAVGEGGSRSGQPARCDGPGDCVTALCLSARACACLYAAAATGWRRPQSEELWARLPALGPSPAASAGRAAAGGQWRSVGYPSVPLCRDSHRLSLGRPPLYAALDRQFRPCFPTDREDRHGFSCFVFSRQGMTAQAAQRLGECTGYPARRGAFPRDRNGRRRGSSTPRHSAGEAGEHCGQLREWAPARGAPGAFDVRWSRSRRARTPRHRVPGPNLPRLPHAKRLLGDRSGPRGVIAAANR